MKPSSPSGYRRRPRPASKPYGVNLSLKVDSFHTRMALKKAAQWQANEAVARRAKEVAAQAKAAAPRRTGLLAGSIRHRAYKRSAFVYTLKSVKYAGAIHWGSSSRNIAPTFFISKFVYTGDLRRSMWEQLKKNKAFRELGMR